MKYKSTLHVNPDEINVLHEALRLYKTHVHSETYIGINPERLNSYRCKVNMMCAVLDEMQKSPHHIISEGSVWSGHTNA
jgi:hypothetical protein